MVNQPMQHQLRCAEPSCREPIIVVVGGEELRLCEPKPLRAYCKLHWPGRPRVLECVEEAA
jgi:hypothetical protein